MLIQVIGDCCPACHATCETVKKVAERIDPAIKVEHIEDIATILQLGVIQMPTVIIDGKTVASGKHLSEKETETLILSMR